MRSLLLLGSSCAALLAAACAQAPQDAAGGLAGTSWQLVKFRGGDGRVQMPVDRSHYSLAFRDGSVAARIDCNRGTGSWKSAGPNRIEFGPMAITRAMCPNPLLHDTVVRQLQYVRSYVIKDGHLFLSLMADGGSFEFEPLK
jgi:para-nitrobenzyl esterase